MTGSPPFTGTLRTCGFPRTSTSVNPGTVNTAYSQTLTQDQLQAMLDKLQQLMKEGRTAEAQALIDKLK